MRMPTKEDFDELLEHTNSEWVNSYNGTGVAGRRFTAANGNHIFLPAAGYRNGRSLSGEGRNGYYWSSSLYTDSPNFTYCLNFYSFNALVLNKLRNYGLTVRPVLGASFP